MGLFDLEEQFAFYGAYHSNPINIVIHMIFVWPILFTALLLLNFIPPFFSQSPIQLLGQSFLVLNYGFLLTVIYALYYVSLDRKAGSLAALLCFLSWAGSSALGHRLGFSLSWKVIFSNFMFDGLDGLICFFFEWLDGIICWYCFVMELWFFIGWKKLLNWGLGIQRRGRLDMGFDWK